MSTNLAAISRQMLFFHGQPAPGARLRFYNAGTTTPITVYQDSLAATPHTWPVVADAYGAAPAIYVPYGSYRLQVLTAGGVVIFDDDNIPNVDPASGSGGGGGGGFTPPTGFIYPTFDSLTPTGYVPLNGGTIGSASSGASVRSNDDTEDLFLHLWDRLLDADAAVVGGRGATAAADWGANKRITLPNVQERGLVGVRTMGTGGASTSLLPSAVIADPTKAGRVFGAGTVTLTTNEMPSHNHGGTTGLTDPLDVYPTFGGIQVNQNAPANTVTVALSTDLRSLSHGHSITSQGGGAAHANVQPSLSCFYYIKL